MTTPQELNTALFLLEKSREGMLGTLEKGAPFVSAAGFAFLKDSPAQDNLGLGGSVYFLLSDLARHTQHIKEDARASLLVLEPRTDIPVHEKKRLTLNGKMEKVTDEAEMSEVRQMYLRLYPRADQFLMLSDFRFYRLLPEELYWVGGFGQIRSFK